MHLSNGSQKYYNDLIDDFFRHMKLSSAKDCECAVSMLQKLQHQLKSKDPYSVLECSEEEGTIAQTVQHLAAIFRHLDRLCHLDSREELSALFLERVRAKIQNIQRAEKFLSAKEEYYPMRLMERRLHAFKIMQSRIAYSSYHAVSEMRPLL